jgi:FkbM family methyltransferase
MLGLRLPLVGLIGLAALILSCGSGDEMHDTPIAKEQSGKNAAIGAVIEKERERLRNLSGRDGILGEERLYSLFDEELIIRDFFQDRRAGVFLDVGCAWPIDSNNTYYLEKHLGWTGIGIDALAEYAPAWKQERPASRFFSYLVSDRSDSAQTFYRSANPGLSSATRENATGRFVGENLETEEIQIDSITLDDLLDREGVTRIDLLSMDIEGHEPAALAGFDIDRFQPELVVVEAGKVLTRDKTDPVARYFEAHGYELIEKYRRFDGVNRYFKRKEPPKARTPEDPPG